ncbi:DNA-binding response regulator [Longispora fulva]|nr:DNA-binding response regulator [Longispora fulva]
MIVDDQAMVRQGFGALLAAQPDIEVVGDAENGAAAVAVAKRTLPDVVLMDVRMPVMDGIESTRIILDQTDRGGAGGRAAGRAGSGDPETHRVRVLILTTFDLDDYVYEALRAGASGFLLKDAPAAELIAAVRVVAAGDGLLAPRVTGRLIAEFARRPSGPPPAALGALTARETEVLVLIARGLSNGEIAAELVIAEQTIKTHVGRILGKLGLRDRAQAVVVAYESGLITPQGQA